MNLHRFSARPVAAKLLSCRPLPGPAVWRLSRFSWAWIVAGVAAMGCSLPAESLGRIDGGIDTGDHDGADGEAPGVGSEGNGDDDLESGDETAGDSGEDEEGGTSDDGDGGDTGESGTSGSGEDGISDPAGVPGLVLWLTAGEDVLAADGLAAEDGDDVASWIDRGPDAVAVEVVTRRADAVRSPTYDADSFGGHPSVVFDGIGYMDILSEVELGSVLLVANSTEGGAVFPGFAGMLGNKNTSAAGSRALLHGNRDEPNINCEQGVERVDGADTSVFTPLGEFKVVSCRLNESWRSGLPLWLGLADGAPPGNVYGWIGGLTEIIAYDRPLSDTELSALEQYLGDRYSIAMSR